MHYENKLSVLRRIWGLTQAELGELVGVSEDVISTYERAIVDPVLAMAVGFELVFGRSLTDIFGQTTYHVAQRMLNILAEMSIELEGADDQDSKLKRRLITQASERIDRIMPTL